MIGRKTLGEVRAELEAAMGKGPTGHGQVAESLQRFLAAGPDATRAPDPTTLPTGPPYRLPRFHSPHRLPLVLSSMTDEELWGQY